MSCSKEKFENHTPSAQHDGPRWRTYFEYSDYDINRKRQLYFADCIGFTGNCLPDVEVWATRLDAIMGMYASNELKNYFLSGENGEIWPDLPQEVLDAAIDDSNQFHVTPYGESTENKILIILPGSVTLDDYTESDVLYALPLIKNQ